MSDYGFKTHDETGATAINAKHHIFGFDMAHTPRAFKTFHFTDAKEGELVDAGLAMPDTTTMDPSGVGWGDGENTQWGAQTTLITKVEHGYNFRPVGYATITGTLNVQNRIKVTQTQIVATTEDFGGNYTYTTVKQEKQGEQLSPNIKSKIWIPYDTWPSFCGPYETLSSADFPNTTWNFPFPEQVMLNHPWGPLGDEDFMDKWSSPDPIHVEIDEKYIYFYRTNLWSDTKRRAKFIDIFTRETTRDLLEQVQIATEFVGSTYDVTVYLCPFSLEMLL